MTRPADALAPSYEREILYRVLQGPQDSALSQVRSAIRWIREHDTEAVEVEQLARMTSMSVSAFHRHQGGDSHEPDPVPKTNPPVAGALVWWFRSLLDLAHPANF